MIFDLPLYSTFVAKIYGGSNVADMMAGHKVKGL